MGVASGQNEHARASKYPPERAHICALQQSDVHGLASVCQGTVLQVQHRLSARRPPGPHGTRQGTVCHMTIHWVHVTIYWVTRYIM